jgi:hypothetical protein
VDWRARGVVQLAFGPDDVAAVDPQLQVDRVRGRGDRRRCQVLHPEGSAGEAGQGGASLRHRPDRSAVAVDGPVDVDPEAADQQLHRRRRHRRSAVAGATQERSPFGVGGKVEADRRDRAEFADRVDDRVVRGAGRCLPRTAEARFEDRCPVAAFEGGALGTRQALDIGGAAQRPLVQKRFGDHVELVLGEGPLSLEEGGGAGELSGRERRHGLRLMSRPHRLVALGGVEVGLVVGVDDQRRRDRAEGDQQDCHEPDPEAAPHRQAPGTAARDSQR